MYGTVVLQFLFNNVKQFLGGAKGISSITGENLECFGQNYETIFYL